MSQQRKWKNLERNLLVYLSLKGASRDLISDLIKRKNDHIFSKLQKHLIMLKTINRILRDLTLNNCENFKEASRIAMAKKSNVFNSYFEYCKDFHFFLVDKESIE